MTDSPKLPGSHSVPIDPNTGRFSTQWTGFFRDLAGYIRSTDGNSEELAQLEARLAALEAAGAIQLSGPFSVQVLGDGTYTFQLIGDTDSPGASYYYGTDVAGAKGFYERLLASLADVDLAGLADGDALVWDATAERFVPGQPSTPQVFTRITADGDVRISADGDIRITD